MGKRKLNSELIPNEKSRIITFQKRKKGLIKKVEELKILCDIDVCVIISGPKLERSSCEMETWPANSDEVKRIINMYRSEGPKLRSKKNQDLSDYFVSRKNKVDSEIAKIKKAIAETKFSKCCDQLRFLSYDQLCSLEKVLAAKIEAATRRFSEMKSNSGFSYTGSYNAGPSVINQSSLLNPNSAHTMHQMNVDFDMQAVGSYSYDLRTVHRTVAISESHADDGILRLLMQGKNYTPSYGVTNNNVWFTPNNNYSYSDPYASMPQASSVFNNSTINPDMYYRQTMQPMLPYMQVPAILNASSQMHNPGIGNLQANDFEELR